MNILALLFDNHYTIQYTVPQVYKHTIILMVGNT